MLCLQCSRLYQKLPRLGGKQQPAYCTLGLWVREGDTGFNLLRKTSYRKPVTPLLSTRGLRHWTADPQDCRPTNRAALLSLPQDFGVTYHLRVSHETPLGQQLFQWRWNRTNGLHYRGLSWDWSEVCSCPFGEEKRKVQSYLNERNPRSWTPLCHPLLHFTVHGQPWGLCGNRYELGNVTHQSATPFCNWQLGFTGAGKAMETAFSQLTFIYRNVSFRDGCSVIKQLPCKPGAFGLILRTPFFKSWVWQLTFAIPGLRKLKQMGPWRLSGCLAFWQVPGQWETVLKTRWGCLWLSFGPHMYAYASAFAPTNAHMHIHTDTYTMSISSGSTRYLEKKGTLPVVRGVQRSSSTQALL